MTLKIPWDAPRMQTILNSRYQPAFFESERPVATPRECQIMSDQDGGEPMRAVQFFQ